MPRAGGAIPAALRRRDGSRSGKYWHLERDPSWLWSQCNENMVARWAPRPHGGRLQGGPHQLLHLQQSFSPGCSGGSRGPRRRG